MRASVSAAESSYAGIVRLVRSAGVGKALFVRLADRYAVMFVPAVLVVSTPCPLVLAAPVAVVSGIAGATRNGTLTAGRAHVVAVVTTPGHEAADVLSPAASVEQASPHVLAAMLVREARDRGLTLVEPTGVIEQPGSGVSGTVSGRQVRVGTSCVPTRRPRSVRCGVPAWIGW